MKFSFLEFRAIWKGMTDEERERVKDKSRWEHMIPWAVLMEWPDLVPTRLRDSADEANRKMRCERA
jgi:hypothetical protein